VYLYQNDERALPENLLSKIIFYPPPDVINGYGELSTGDKAAGV
jgi:hypothetical protein